MRQVYHQFLLVAIIVWPSGCAVFTPGQKLNYHTVSADPHHDAEKARAENERALKLLEKGKLGKAEQALQQSLIADVTFGPAHNNLGELYFRQGKYYLAAWEFEYAAKLMPERSEPHNNLGLVYEEVGKFTEAIEAYEIAHILQPINPQYIGNLARAKLQCGASHVEVRQLLRDLVFLDTRNDWVAWAKEQLTLADLSSTQPSPEVIPPPHGTQGYEVLQ